MRDPESLVTSELASGGSTRYVQVGMLPIAVSIAGAVGFVLGIVFAHAYALIMGLVIVAYAGTLTSTLTIDLDDERIRWYFTGKLFGGSLAYGDIISCEPARTTPFATGYRMGFNTCVWNVAGRDAISMLRVSTGVLYVIGTDRAQAVCAEVERRKAAADARA